MFHQEFVAVEHATPVTGYDVVVCGACGAGYADGIPAQEAFDRYYRDMSNYEYAQRGGEESEFDRRRLTLVAGLVAQHLPAVDVRVLDVGCASGRLLAALRDLGYGRVTGLDPSPASATAAQRLYGIEVRTMTLGAIAAAGNHFDVVILVGVLEHLRDLDVSCGHLHALLPTHGLLYLEVPDVTSFADWPNAAYQEFSTEHINFFSPASLDNLMRRHGFSRVFLEQNHREQSYRTTMSNVSAVYRREDVPLGPIRFNTDTVTGLERYLARSAADEQRLLEQIDALVDSQRRLLVWGVGTHTRRLLASSRLADANIVAFLESNRGYHGKALVGRPILAPEALRDYSEPVLISSRVFEKEIADQIRLGLRCTNELILLYHV